MFQENGLKQEVQNLDHMDLCTFICYFVMETYDVAM
jgi:hypothetical protein